MITIVVPTYWRKEKKGRIVEIIESLMEFFFDHPTPLDERGSLSRCLDSFNRIEGNFIVILLVVPSSLDIKDKLRKRIEEIIKLPRKYKILPFFYDDLEFFSSVLKKKIMHADSLLNFKGYSRCRNMGLLVSYILGSDYLIFIDDDEVIEDKRFLKKAVRYIGKDFHGKKIGAKGGLYVQRNGKIYLSKEKRWWRKYFDNKKQINETLKALRRKKISDAIMSLGGNMVISRKLIESGVPFDPYIPRGEDIDYLINAKMDGWGFIFDNELEIKHLPPEFGLPKWYKLMQDSRRFLYERAKLKKQKVYGVKNELSVENLKPYPGFFLDSKIYFRILITSLLLSLHYLRKSEFGASWHSLKILKLFFRNYDKDVERFFEFKKMWKRLLKISKEEKCLKEYLVKNIRKPNSAS